MAVWSFGLVAGRPCGLGSMFRQWEAAGTLTSSHPKGLHVGARSPVGREVGGEGVYGNPQGFIMGPSQRCITGVCHGGLSQGSRVADL